LSNFSTYNVFVYVCFVDPSNFFLACQTAVHKKCHDKLLTQCPGTGRDTESTVVSRSNYEWKRLLLIISFGDINKTKSCKILQNYKRLWWIG